MLIRLPNPYTYLKKLSWLYDLVKKIEIQIQNRKICHATQFFLALLKFYFSKLSNLFVFKMMSILGDDPHFKQKKSQKS